MLAWLQEILGWLREKEAITPLISTLIALPAAGVMYYLAARYIRNAKRSPIWKIQRRLGLRVGMLLLLALALFIIWNDLVPAWDQAHAWALEHNFYASLIAIAALVAIINGLASMVERNLVKDVTELDARHRIRSMTRWGARGLSILAALLVLMLNMGLQNLGTFLGLVGAGLALSMQESLLCLAGWGLVMLHKHYDIGDRIEVGSIKGDVIDVSLFQTSLLEVGNWVHGDQSTGRLLHFPNSMIFRHPVFNYTRGFPFIWNEAQVTVTFESDWKRAKALVLESAVKESKKIESEVRSLIKKMQSQYPIKYDHLTPIVYTTIAASGVNLTLRYLVPVKRARMFEHQIHEAILGAFLEEREIDFAYPTTRIYRNPEEGKPGTGGPTDGEPVHVRPFYAQIQSAQEEDEEAED